MIWPKSFLVFYAITKVTKYSANFRREKIGLESVKIELLKNFSLRAENPINY